MTPTMLTAHALPASAECRCVLADGRVLTVTASRRPRANRADVKCVVTGAPAISERMQEVVRLARHTESRFDSRDQVVLGMDIVPAAEERGWELAAVLADRKVRGLPPFALAAATSTASSAGAAEHRATEIAAATAVSKARPRATAPASVAPDSPAPGAPRLYAYGWSDTWHLGRVTGQPAQAAVRAARHLAPEDQFIAGDDGSADQAPQAGVTLISHLGALSGHADPSAAVSSARAWFPLHSGGINDTLSWVEVSVYPLEGPGVDEESTIAAPGLDLTVLNTLRQTLSAARHFDGKGLGRWRTVVRFAQPRFQGESYQLALVMADRLARGREFVPRGRLIASGCSSAWHAGRVDTVEGREPKLELILKQAAGGDRVLLPQAWQAALPEQYQKALKARGASLACISQIGMI